MKQNLPQKCSMVGQIPNSRWATGPNVTTWEEQDSEQQMWLKYKQQNVWFFQTQRILEDKTVSTL